MNGWGIFSTLRVSQGTLFAYERHYNRMAHDAVRLHVPLNISAKELHAALMRLVRANRVIEGTLRVAVVRNRGGLFEGPDLRCDSDVIAFTADLVDWGAGLRLTYVPNARHSGSPFAGTKVTSWADNLTLYEQAHEEGFDEVVLLNEAGQVSECTSANIFVIQGNHVWTPPLESSGCLPGVTRAIFLEEISRETIKHGGIKIAERELTPSELEDSDQVFITSTTRDLLPVQEIDHKALAQNSEVLHKLQRAFLAYRIEYMSSSGADSCDALAGTAALHSHS